VKPARRIFLVPYGPCVREEDQWRVWGNRKVPPVLTTTFNLFAVHLRLPAIEPGVKAFVWALLLGVYLWGFLILAVGMDKGTSTVLGLIAFGAIFLLVRIYGESDEP
jgi:hypothetical protein